jgi:hypothetical protein
MHSSTGKCSFKALCHKQRKIELAGIEPAWPLDHRALLTLVWQHMITPATPQFVLGQHATTCNWPN